MVEDSVIEQKFDYTLDEAAESIQAIFEHENWRWWGTGAPSVEDVKNMIIDLRADVSEEDGYWTSCGRLRVHKDPDAEQYVVSVEFYLSD